jgi:hypothetical protein
MLIGIRNKVLPKGICTFINWLWDLSQANSSQFVKIGWDWFVDKFIVA